MAAIACFETMYAQRGASALRPVRLISFERDLDPLILATQKSARFPHLQHAAPHGLLDSGCWKHASGLLSWELVEGDFLARFDAAPAPDLVFYDPFSPKTDHALWSSDVFDRLARHGGHRRMELYTYTASTAVRAALLWAGFWVAAGVGIGPKATTTIACSFAPAEPVPFEGTDGAVPWLGDDWLARWRRSDARYPSGLSEIDQAAYCLRIESHRQFARRSARLAD